MIASTHQEAFSCAFVRAVAANSGCSIGKPEPDRDGIDYTISNEEYCFPKLDVQVKSTKNFSFDGNYVAYDITKKAYNFLCMPSHTPRILILVTLPNSHLMWSEATEKNLILRNCAYWMNLKGLSALSGKGKVRIKIPRTNIFDQNSLCGMMKVISRSGAL
jgi:hypothetical protein